VLYFASSLNLCLHHPRRYTTLILTIGAFIESELLFLSTKSLYPIEAITKLSPYRRVTNPQKENVSFMDHISDSILKLRTSMKIDENYSRYHHLFRKLHRASYLKNGDSKLWQASLRTCIEDTPGKTIENLRPASNLISGREVINQN
ncbi:hypothetical protein DVH24_035965, partial [Malus domestica]